MRRAGITGLPRQSSRPESRRPAPPPASISKTNDLDQGCAPAKLSSMRESGSRRLFRETFRRSSLQGDMHKLALAGVVVIAFAKAANAQPCGFTNEPFAGGVG